MSLQGQQPLAKHTTLYLALEAAASQLAEILK